MKYGNNKKIIVLGLDGGTWDLLNILMDEGLMPNLKTIVQNGSSGVLNSTLPPYTAPAWVSCITGVNPGKHGIFGFTLKKNGRVIGEFANSTYIRFPRIWNYINHAGRKVGLINVPITYPAEPVDGFMVPCFFTPLGKIDYTYPKSIYKDVLVPLNYVINVRLVDLEHLSEKMITKAIYAIKNMTQRRSDVMEALYETYKPDFFMVVFTSLDKVQHKFWKFLDPHDALSKTYFASRIRPLLISVYEQIDTIVGNVLAQLDSNTTLYLVSDHGFGPQNKCFFVNKWLAQNGFLKIKKIQFLTNRLLSKYFKKGEYFQRNVDIAKHPIYNFLDFKKSCFIGSDQYEQGIYATRTLQAPDYSEKISSLMQKLNGLKDDETGKPIFERIYHRDELYTGKYSKYAPDIVLQMKDYSINMLRSYPMKNKIFNKNLAPDGCHHPEGIFAAYGKDIVPGNKTSASIMDVAPTILFNMGLPGNRAMDGVVRKEIFTPSFQKCHDVIYRDNFDFRRAAPIQQGKFKNSEKEEIAAKLRDLGYFE